MKERLMSFKFAWQGLKYAFHAEFNMRIHVIAAITAIGAGWIMKIERWEWICIIFAIALVFITELLNSALEFLADSVNPDYHEKIGKAKDISAGAVLIAACIALIIAALIFIPKLI